MPTMNEPKTQCIIRAGAYELTFRWDFMVCPRTSFTAREEIFVLGFRCRRGQ